MQPPWFATPAGALVQGIAQHGEHAQGQHIDLEQAHDVEIVLVPLNDGALGHRGRLDGHQARELALGQHEAAHMLTEMARAVLELPGQLYPQAQPMRAHCAIHLACQHLGFLELALHPVFGQSFGRLVLLCRVRRFGMRPCLCLGMLAEPVLPLGQGIDQIGGQAQRLAHIAQRAAAAPAADHGRERRALAPVLAVDVLNNLFAPRVLEVHIDIGRLAALLADKALEQQIVVFRIYRRNAQAVADRRIGRRSAPLAQNADAARIAHDVMHGEKVHLVLLILDQRQLFVQLIVHVLGNALGIASRRAIPGQPGQGLRGRHAGQHALLRIVVANLVQAEAATPGQLQRRLQHDPGIERSQPQTRAQMPLGIGLQRKAAFGHGAPQAYCRDHILQRLARARMHMDIAAGQQRQAQHHASLLQGLQPQAVVGRQMQLHTQPQDICRKMRCNVFQTSGYSYQIRCIELLALRQQQTFAALLQQLPGTGFIDQILPFGSPAACNGDEFTEIAPALQITHQHHDPERTPGEFAAMDQVQVAVSRRLMSAHGTGHRALVGQRQRRIAQAFGPVHQLGRR